MAQTTNVVNLDALIRRADLASPGETGEDIESLSIMGLGPKGMLYPALRKPDFQRETANWTPDQVATLISTFARRELIPAIILWRAGNDVFVIDGAHRLSALIAWVHDDYGDGDASRRFFQNTIPDDQARAATRTRELVKAAIGSYADHRIAIEFPETSRPDVAERANRIAWQPIPAQWIRDADHEKAEKAFFRINQGGTKIEPVEKRIIASRRSATALAARAILRGGAGHNYWKAFAVETRTKIEELGGEIHRLLFEPPMELPLRTLDLPLGGHGYGPKALPFVFDLVTVVNRVQVKDSSNKRVTDDEDLVEDIDGSTTISFLISVQKTVQRICSSHPSSLGLHPALYFYARSGTFQPTSLLGYVLLFADWSTEDFLAFTRIRSRYEEFVLTNGGLTEAVRRLGSGSRSRPRMLAWHREVIRLLMAGSSASEVASVLRENPDFAFFVTPEAPDLLEQPGSSFTREVKGAAYLRDALPSAPKCPTCGGMMHRNGMQVGHQKAKRDGGSGGLDNAMMQHPFCNSTVAN